MWIRCLNLTGGTVSIDAMGTPTAIARTIIDGGGDYTLAIQGNQPTMHEPVKDLFETVPTNDFKAGTVEKAQPTVELKLALKGLGWRKSSGHSSPGA